MDAPLNQVLFPDNLPELFAAWNRFPDAVPYAGGTALTGKRGKENATEVTPVYLSLEKIEELNRITRTEQYLEIGSMTVLNRLINLGKIVPAVLCKCLLDIAGVQLRNIATVGGNICNTTRLLDLPAILTALDAQYEFKNAVSARWVSAARFHSEEKTTLEKQELLTRVRLPLHQWDYAVYRKFKREDSILSESLVFLAKTRKNILSDIRVIYKGREILRNKNAEDLLIGKYLPISRKTANDFIFNWMDLLAQKQEIGEFSMSSILNSIEENVYNLSE